MPKEFSSARDYCSQSRKIALKPCVLSGGAALDNVSVLNFETE